MRRRMKFVEIVCSQCQGDGFIPEYDEWCGRLEKLCYCCRGEGRVLVHKLWAKLGFQILDTTPINETPEFYLDNGDFARLYVKKGPVYYHWANWSVGVIKKDESEQEICDYKITSLLDKFEGNMELMIRMFYESKDEWMYCEYASNEGNPYSELIPGEEEKWENHFSAIYDN